MIQYNFVWDKHKAQTNVIKHNVSFDEAKSVFYDKYAMSFYDKTHSILEDRFLFLGYSNKNRILLIVYCDIENINTIRIISARKATKNEAKKYKR